MTYLSNAQFKGIACSHFLELLFLLSPSFSFNIAHFQRICHFPKSLGRLLRPRFRKSLDPQISSLVGYFKKTNAFLVYFICFNETVHDKWCSYKSVRQIENGLERGFVKL